MLRQYHLRRSEENVKSIDKRAPGAQGGQIVNAQVATLVSVIYVTAPQTFTGAIGGYTTMNAIAPAATTTARGLAAAQSSSAKSIAQIVSGALVQSQASSVARSTATTAAVVSETVAYGLATTTHNAASLMDTPVTSLSDSIAITSASSPLPSTTLTPSKIAGSPLSSVDATSSSQTSNPAILSQATSGGLSAGATAGIAIVVTLILASLLALALFCYRRRKKQLLDFPDEHSQNEKNPFSDNAALPHSPTPFSLGVQPTTESTSEAGIHTGAGDVMSITGPVQNTSPNDPEKAGVHTQVTNPFKYNVESSLVGQEMLASPAIRAPFSEAVADAVSPTLVQRHIPPKALDPNRLEYPVPVAISSPAGTEFSMSSMSSGAMVNCPLPTNVHRIQLDFKPSMEDELELKAGQLVRLLHEYDDGWALCVRLDRSQQGVAPRTCLSTRPVKARSKASMGGAPQTGMHPGQHSALRAQTQNDVSSSTIEMRSTSASGDHKRRNSPPRSSLMTPQAQVDVQRVTSPPSSSHGIVARKPVPSQVT